LEDTKAVINQRSKSDDTQYTGKKKSITASPFVIFLLAIVLFVIRITASPFVPFLLAIVLCVIRIIASPFIPFHLAIVLCVISVIRMTHNTIAK
jgi:glucan phosphoethanolaminetransferase (alkaline phosphatase superfamily)